MPRLSILRTGTRAVAIALLLAAALPALAADAFLKAAADLPLMPGLAEVEGAGVLFDKPDGRIVEAYAFGEVAAAAVRRFYAETLPQLGWRARGGMNFEREGERLTLTLGGRDGALTVRFDIVPR
jgi:hypothetical protein